MQQNEFQHIPAAFWVYLLLPFTVIAVTLIGIKTHNPFMFGMIGVIPFAILLMNRIDLWLVTIFAIYNSRLRVPGLIGELELVHILMAGLVGVVFLRFIIAKQGTPRKAWMWRFIYAFAAVVLVTMVVKGSGFRILGDYKWGGMRYVELLLTLAFPFVVTNLRLTATQWKTAIVAMSLLALLPFLADALFLISRGAIYHHYYLIKQGAVRTAYQTYGTGVMTRFISGASSGWAVMILPFFLFPLEKRNQMKYIPFIVAGLMLSATSGHRLGIINIIGFLWLFGFYEAKGFRVGYTAVSFIVVLLFMGLSILLSPYLPLAVQRSLSFIPFMKLDTNVMIDAAGTLDWRWDVWKDAWHYELPRYFMLGKGYAYEGDLLASPTLNRTPIDWARITVSYHNGFFSLMIGLGIMGLLTGVGVMVSAIARHHHFAEQRWYDPRLKQYHAVLFVVFSLACFRFIFVYGDVHVSFPGLFKIIALMEGLVVANMVLAGQVEPSPDDQPEKVEKPKIRKISLGI